MLGAHYRDYGDYQSPEGTVFNSASEMLGFRAGWQVAAFNGIFHVGWRTDEARDVGKPTPDSEIRRVYYPEETSNRLSLGFERPTTSRSAQTPNDRSATGEWFSGRTSTAATTSGL